MEIADLITLELGLITLIGTGVWRLMTSVSTRFDKVDASIERLHERVSSTKSGLNGRIDEMKDNSHREHKKIGERLARIETTLEIEETDG